MVIKALLSANRTVVHMLRRLFDSRPFQVAAFQPAKAHVPLDRRTLEQRLLAASQKHGFARQVRRSVHQAGMTLLEIIIVVALLATLMGILVTNILGPQEQAKIDQAKLQMGQIGQALQMYSVYNFAYPTTAEGLGALVNPPSSAKFKDSLLKEGQISDPWNNEFDYESSSRKQYLITSAGPDGEFGTDDDISQNEKGSVDAEAEE